ncbi:MAG: multicopper oxidase domain-containing protein, partial [Candidatus Rokubacteria bacterium]|nr:multicopper oxidase domain-containing protein [Candidatus Rokubacteria bacterium]
RLSQTLLLAGLLLQVSPVEAQTKGADPYAYLTASALGKTPPLPDTTSIRPTGRTREFTLDLRPGSWEPVKGVKAPAITINGTVPGPLIRVTEGDRVVVTVRNNLEESTSIHWHGLHVPNAMDGVEGLTQEAIGPGRTFRYEFLASHAGTFMYHSHSHARAIEQIDAGLYGMFVIDPQNPRGHPKFDRELLMTLSAWNIAEGGGHEMGGMQYNYFTINGRAYPDAPEWAVKRGDVVRIRIANVSNLVHPMHLHGHDFVVLAKDGEPLKAPQTMNTVNVAPGETYDVAFVANNPGAWLFHCHELHHTMNGSSQPGGLIQVIRYEGSASVPAAPKAAPAPSKPSSGAGHRSGH